MTKKEKELRMAAAGYPPQKKPSKRMPRIQLGLDDPELLREMRMKKVRDTLNLVGGNKAKATKLLGIARTTLYRWLNEIED